MPDTRFEQIADEVYATYDFRNIPNQATVKHLLAEAARRGYRISGGA